MSTIVSKTVNLENALAVPIEREFTINTDPDVLNQLLTDKRSPNTRRAYEKDVNDFFKAMTGKLPSQDTVLEFLHLDRYKANAVVLKYKASLVKRGLKESTVNRRLAALKSLVAMGRKLGVCDYSLEDIKGEKVSKYRDTTGITPDSYKKVLALCDRLSLIGKRDYALLKLLWDNALRRNEVSQLSIRDFDPYRQELTILGKGRGTQVEVIGLSRATTEAILDYLKERRELDLNAPLFIAHDFHNQGHRLSGDAIYKMVKRYCQKAGISKPMSPHRVRHSAITAALDATDGNVRKVQKLSRHKNIETVLVYDDNRQKVQHELTELLSTLTD